MSSCSKDDHTSPTIPYVNVSGPILPTIHLAVFGQILLMKNDSWAKLSKLRKSKKLCKRWVHSDPSQTMINMFENWLNNLRCRTILTEGLMNQHCHWICFGLFA